MKRFVFIILILLLSHKVEVKYALSHTATWSSFKLKRLSCYHATVSQCDSTPYLTASMHVIKKSKIKKHRIIAISREVKEKLCLFWGQKIIIFAHKYAVIGYIHDFTSLKIKNCADVLFLENEKNILFKNATLFYQKHGNND